MFPQKKLPPRCLLSYPCAPFLAGATLCPCLLAPFELSSASSSSLVIRSLPSLGGGAALVGGGHLRSPMSVRGVVSMGGLMVVLGLGYGWLVLGGLVGSIDAPLLAR